MNIYVGNLSYEVTEEELEEAFEVFGEVESVNIISDKFTGRLKGFGVVEMPDNAIARLRGDEHDYSTCTIQALGASDPG